MTIHRFDPNIVRAYDIRGVFGSNLFEIDAYFLARSLVVAFQNILQLQPSNNFIKIAVGCDGRTSSPLLKRQLLAGLEKSGVSVVDIGLVATPMLYFAVKKLNCDAGIMITGSHNPKDHNGFKITLNQQPFFGNQLLELQNILERNNFIEETGSYEAFDILPSYIKRITEDCLIAKSQSHLLDEIDEPNEAKTLKIAWDAGNGAAAVFLAKLSNNLLSENHLLFAEIDGDFPNHHPDPTVEENLTALKDFVVKNQCDLGIAFDGDADRIGVVDNCGEVLWGDQLLAILSSDILLTKPGSSIIADVKASSTLFEAIRSMGGNAIMCRTGHSFIKSKMQETKAVLAGEMSGHIFFADRYYGFDDAAYASIRLINILHQQKKPLSQIRQILPKVFATKEIQIPASDDAKFKIIEKMQDQLNLENIAFNNIDGIRVDFDGGWWLIRASNTQPALIIRCEGISEAKLNLAKNQLIKLLHQNNLVVNL
jgi:phosphomannomutase